MIIIVNQEKSLRSKLINLYRAAFVAIDCACRTFQFEEMHLISLIMRFNLSAKSSVNLFYLLYLNLQQAKKED